MPRTPLAVTTALATVAAAALAPRPAAPAGAAEAGSAAGSAESGAGGFPVTIEHAYGETTIEAQPERIATVAWANHEVPLALGVVPGRHEQGDLGRRRRRRRPARGSRTSSRSSAPRRRCCSTRPTASTSRPSPTPSPTSSSPSYSGLTQEEYDTLSKIAPVVAYPEVAWGDLLSGHDPDELRRRSASPTRASSSSTTCDAEVDAALAANPELGRVEDALLLHRPHRPQPDRLLHEPRHPPRLPRRASACRCRRSSRRSRRRPTSSTSSSAPRRPTASPTSTSSSPTATPRRRLIASCRPTRCCRRSRRSPRARSRSCENSTPLAASANPSPLSIGWGIDEYFALLAGALDQAE